MPKERYTVQLAVRVKPSMLQKLQDFADEDEQDFSVLVRDILARAIKQRQLKKYKGKRDETAT